MRIVENYIFLQMTRIPLILILYRKCLKLYSKYKINGYLLTQI